MANTPTTSIAKTGTSFYLNSALKLYLISLIAYLPFLFNFMWGNHDWEWIKTGTPLKSGLFEGRFSQFILQNVLFGGQILPVLTLLTALAFFCIGTILLLKLWNIPPKTKLYLIIGALTTTAPYTLSWLYFAFITLSCLSWSCTVIYAYYLLEKKHIIRFISAIILFTLSLGGYPPVINLIGLLLFSLILKDLCLKKLTVTSILRKYTTHICAVALSGILFIIIQQLLKHYHLQYATYNTAELDITQIPAKIAFCLQAMVQQFFITTSFIEKFYKYCGLCLFLLSIIALWHNLPKKLSSICLFIFCLLGLLFSSLLTVFLTPNTTHVLYEPRIEFFGLMYIYIFSISILCSIPNNFIRNLCYLAGFFLILNNINTQAFAAKVWQLGYQSEMRLSERIIKQLEQKPHFNPNEKYTFVQSGISDFRSRFYHHTNLSKKDGYTLTAPYIPWHLPSKAYQFYYPKEFVSADFDVYWSYIDEKQIAITPTLIQYLNKQAQPWPSPNSIYISPELIILTLSYDGKIRGQNWINEQTKKSTPLFFE